MLQVRGNTPFNGLCFLHYDELHAHWNDWRVWYHSGFALDQGSDILSTSYAMAYLEKIKLNITQYFDGEHGQNRDVWGTAADVGLKNFLHITMLALNVDVGPDDTGLRYHQRRACLIQFYQKHKPENAPLFQYLNGRMWAAFGHLVPKEDGETRLQAMWRFASQRAEQKPMGEKVYTGRFNAIIAGSRDLLLFWPLELHDSTVLRMENSFISANQLPKIKLVLSGHDQGSNRESTSKHLLSVAERSLKQAGANACVQKLGFLSDARNQRILSIFIGVTLKGMEWSGECSRSTRCVGDAQKWFKMQLKTGLKTHFMRICATVMDKDPHRGLWLLVRQPGWHHGR